MQLEYTPLTSPPWYIVLPILFGLGIVVSVVRRSKWRYSEPFLIGIRWTVLIFSIYVIGMTAMGLSSRAAVPRFESAVNASPFDQLGTYYSPSAGWGIEGVGNGISRQRLRRFHWLFGGSVALILLAYIGTGMVRRSAARHPAAANVARTSPSPSTPGWLVVPALGLAVLGYLARPSLLPSTDHDLTRKSQALAEQQLHTEKVLREVRDGSTLAGPGAPPIPDWLKNGVVTSSQFLLSSGQFSSVQEAENQLLPHAAYLLQRAFQENHPWEGVWTVPLAEIRECVVDNVFIEQGDKTIGKFSGKIYRVHMRVDVSPRVCETFTSAWKSQIVRHRLEVLGVLLGWITCCLFVATLYFRRAAHPENFLGWWGQLKVSAVTLGLTAAAAWVLVDVVG